MKQVLRRTAITVAFLLALVTSVQAREQAKDRVSFNINAPSMAQALIEFTQQSGLQMLMPTNGATEAPAPKVVGSYTPEAALDQLLVGTDLRYEFTNERTVAIRTADASGRSAARSSRASREKVQEKITLAQARAEEDSNVPRTEQTPASGAASPTQRAGIPEILIRGSKVSNADIPRTPDDIEPYVVLSRETIERSNAATLEDFLKNNVPMNTASVSLDQQMGFSTTPQGNINLRGLGTNQTLVLVDGRRLASAGTVSGAFAQPDISGIPLASIERIEILPTSAGAIYGGGATGGVINIIRRRNYSGLDVSVQYGNTFSNDMEDLRSSAAGGWSSASGKTSVTLSGSYAKANPLLSTERDFARRARERVLSNNPAAILGSGSPVPSRTPNICARGPSFCSTTIPLVLDSGVSLLSPVTYASSGYQGSSSDAGTGLLNNAGAYNIDVPFDGQYLLRSPIRSTFSLGVRQELTSWLQLDMNGSKNKNQSDLTSPDQFPAITVDANAANNPFRQTVIVSVPIRLQRAGRADSESTDGNVSLIGRLPGEWSVALERTWSQSRSSFKGKSSALVSDAGMTVLRQSPAIFADTPASLPDLTPYLTSQYDTFSGPIVQTLNGISLRLSGPTFDLPAGPITLAAVAEHRYEHLRDVIQESAVTTPSVFTLTPRQSQSVDSYYLEGRVPIISFLNSITGVSVLELQGAIRRDSYRTKSTRSLVRLTSLDSPYPQIDYFGSDYSSTDYLVGMRYSPIKDVVLRASVGTGFLPPAVNQLVPTFQTANTTTLQDPKRGNTRIPTPFTLVSNGNPGLLPESSRSVSYGVIFTPRLVEGLRLSIDFTSIEKTDEIANPGGQYFINNEDFYQSRVIRGPNLPGDPAGWAGPITQIDGSNTNLFFTSVESLDFSFDFHKDVGRLGSFGLSLLASRARGFERQINLTSPVLDYVSYLGGPLVWRGSGGVDWEKGAWSISWNTQYFNRYNLYAPNVTPATLSGIIANNGSGTVPRQIYHDLAFRYRPSEARNGILGGVDVRLGIQNVFNTNPPIIGSSLSAFGGNTYSNYGDPRLRRYFIFLQKSL